MVSVEPVTAKQQAKTDEVLKKRAERFHKRLADASPPVPGLFKLMIFRMSRTASELMAEETNRDHTYWRDQGWFESDYYYPVRLGPAEKLAGKLFDAMAVSRTKSR